jgi:hypothetical protein
VETLTFLKDQSLETTAPTEKFICPRHGSCEAHVSYRASI